jgi:hypothetical protein
VSGLPPARGDRSGRRPGWPATLSLFTVFGIGFIDYLGAAAGSVHFVLEATAIALAALIILGWTRLVPAMSMIAVGVAYLVLAIAVIGWEVLDGVAMIATGAVAVTFGVASISPSAIGARTRQLAKWATRARRP